MSYGCQRPSYVLRDAKKLSSSRINARLKSSRSRVSELLNFTLDGRYLQIAVYDVVTGMLIFFLLG